MTFLNPLLLFIFLPLASIPIIIHLVNRRRYKPLPWAATYFLTQAKKSSTRFEKVRQWLILALRTLAIIALAFTLGRPLAGGLLGWAFDGKVDTIIVILDRSASLNTIDQGHSSTRLQRVKAILLDALETKGEDAHIMLLDSAKSKLIHLKDKSLLKDQTLFGETDTSADIPQLLRIANRYIRENDSAKTEVWLASDMQASSWQSSSTEWQSLSQSFNKLKQEVPIRVLGLKSTETNGNSSLSLRSTSIVENVQKKQIKIDLKLQSPKLVDTVVSLRFNIAGNEFLRDVKVKSAQSYISESFDLDESTGRLSYGSVSLESDSNNSDNTVYFATATQQEAQITIVSDNAKTAQIQSFLVNPLLAHKTKVLNSEAFAQSELSTSSILILCDGPFTDESLNKKVLDYVTDGGTAFLFPPLENKVVSFAEIDFNPHELSRSSRAFTVKSWQREYGPLAKDSTGVNLSLDKVQINRYSPLTVNKDFISLAKLDNKQDFIVQVEHGSGEIFCINTRSEKAWSSLYEGTVLLPFYDRLIRHSLRSFMDIRDVQPAKFKLTGQVQKLLGVNNLSSDQSLSAGLFKRDLQHFVANVDESEKSTDFLDEDQVLELSKGMNLSIFQTESSSQEAEESHSELARGFLLLMLIALMIESALTLRRRQEEAKA